MRNKTIAIFAVALALPLTARAGHDCAAAGAGHSCEAEDLALRMIDAHGGMDAWKKAPTVSFKHTMVDPRLRGVEYVVTYGAMLDLMNMPPEVTAIGPLVKVFDDFTTVDGLTVPKKYTTYVQGQVYGEHTVEDISFHKTFDASVLEMPDDATIDTSSAKRRVVAN